MRSTINVSLNLYQPQAISCLYHVACYIYTDMNELRPGLRQRPAQHAGQPIMDTLHGDRVQMPEPFPRPLPLNVGQTQQNRLQGWLSSTLSSEIDKTYNMGM